MWGLGFGISVAAKPVRGVVLSSDPEDVGAFFGVGERGDGNGEPACQLTNFEKDHGSV